MGWRRELRWCLGISEGGRQQPEGGIKLENEEGGLESAKAKNKGRGTGETEEGEREGEEFQHCSLSVGTIFRNGSGTVKCGHMYSSL